MAIKINNERYETKRFECWPRLKELRSEHFWRTWNIQKEGGLVVLGMYSHTPILAGMGDYAAPTIGVHFTRLSRTPNGEGLVQAIEFAEAWGLGRNVCGAVKIHLGQLFQGLSTTSPMGEKIKHDFAFRNAQCYANNKNVQLAAQYVGVPYLMIERGAKPTANGRRYFLAQLQEAIEWIEQKTGRKYDDEKLVEGTINFITSGVLLAKCFDLLKNIPAPASLRDMFSLRIPVTNEGHRKEVVDYASMLYDELKYRAEKKISARGIEKVRLDYENVFPFHRGDILRSPEWYGGLFINGAFAEGPSFWEKAADGSQVPARTLEEKGIVIKTREDALNAFADYMPPLFSDDDHTEFYRRARDWHSSAVVIQYDRTCQQAMLHTPGNKLYLEEKGVPVGTYSCPQGDPREFDERRVYRDLNTFYESLGLTRMESGTPSKTQAEAADL